MKKTLEEMLKGYHTFREKYATGDNALMQQLSYHGQKPKAMLVSCCDSRVDPALLLQCEPGDLFITRNVANIVPPFESDTGHHGTSAALEFGICYLNIKHLIILGHSQCGGIHALMNQPSLKQNDFISRWVNVIDTLPGKEDSVDDFAKKALHCSYQNCLTFPWIKERVEQNALWIHLWYFDIKQGEILAFDKSSQEFSHLEDLRVYTVDT